MTGLFAVARRILLQFAHDKRTLALLFVAPLVVLWLLSVLLGADTTDPRIAAVSLPDAYVTQLERQEAEVRVTDQAEADRLLADDEIDAALSMKDDKTLLITAEGSDATKTAAVASAATKALAELRQDSAENAQQQIKDQMAQVSKLLATMPGAPAGAAPSLDLDLDTDLASASPIDDIDTAYLHGSEDWKMFDYYGPVFIGVFLFAFTFITSGMSLVTERTNGTMERFLATPVKPFQILGGYVLAYGLLAAVQSAVILWVALTFIGFPNEGSVGWVVLTTVSMALVSVTLGLLVSRLARSAFQVIQLILLFVVPQILLCGMFDLAGTPTWMQALGKVMPLTYGVDALRDVMLRGAGFDRIAGDLAVIWLFVAVFFVFAALGLRKKRAR